MDSTTATTRFPVRDKRAEALSAYYAGTAAVLPIDNPYRWLVQNHDFNPQHRGMQPNCPVCTDEVSPVARCACGKSALHLTAHEDTQAWACRVPAPQVRHWENVTLAGVEVNTDPMRDPECTCPWVESETLGDHREYDPQCPEHGLEPLLETWAGGAA